MTDGNSSCVKDVLMKQMETNRILLCKLQCSSERLEYLNNFSPVMNDQDDSPEKIQKMVDTLSSLLQEIAREYRKQSDLSDQMRKLPARTQMNQCDSGIESGCFCDSYKIPMQESLEEETECNAQEHSMELSTKL